jgi:TonB family protein
MTPNDFIVFIYESGICLAILFIMYWLFLKRETYFRFNRFYLLSSLIVAFALPLMNIGLFESSDELSPLRSISNLSETVNLPAVTITHASESLSASVYNWKQIALIIYLLGVSLLIARVILGILRVEMLKRKGRRIFKDGYSIVYTQQAISPFSFFRTIYLNDELAEQADSAYIINHEKVHIKQRHTYDNLFVELFLAVFWFNPFMWFLKGALRENHEYLADNGVLNQKANPSTYQTLLLRQTVGLAPITLTSTFNSTIKNRIIMMCKNKSSVIARFKPLLLLPIIAALFLIFTCNDKTKAQALSENQTLPSVEDTNGIRQEADPETGEVYFAIEDMPTYSDGESSDTRPDDAEPGGEESRNPESSNPGTLEAGSSDAESDTETPSEVEFREAAAEPQEVQQDTIRKEREKYFVVEDMPVFGDGGDPAIEFRKFIAKNLQYPESAARDSISGRVIVQFCVNYEGNVVDPVVVRSVSPALDDEAIRVVSSSPPWTPGRQRGKPVDVLFTFPINFVIQ